MVAGKVTYLISLIPGLPSVVYLLHYNCVCLCMCECFSFHVSVLAVCLRTEPEKSGSKHCRV